MKRNEQPHIVVSTAVMTAVLALWTYLRLVAFHDSVFPLTFVVPLLLCVWSRRIWQLVVMAVFFAAVAIVKFQFVMPDDLLSPREARTVLLVTEFNILAGAMVISAIMLLRDRLEERNARITAQNAELEAQTEELTGQNEEIKAQSEELAQQHEQIESQAEELERQNIELIESNERLSDREQLLQSILESSRSASKTAQVLQRVCERAIELVDEPACAIVVLERDGDTLHTRASCTSDALCDLPAQWPIDGSLTRVVLEENRTAYVDDLQARADLSAPFGAGSAVRSMLASPIHLSGRPGGVIVACSSRAGHWTQEQFRILEWLAAECGIILESLHWQKALQERTREVEAANRAKDQFLATLSHELRTPLTPVLAAAGTLAADTRLPEDARADAHMIRRNIAIQSRLIDDLLDLTRIERGKVELHLEVLDIAELLRQSAGIVAVELDAKDQILTVDLNLPAGCAVVGDSARLQQVFWNLLRNAIKFSPAKGRVELAARIDAAPDPRVVVEVRDWGVGIEPENLDRIFRPFDQGKEAMQGARSEGLGLGLSIARAIVELHRGTIAARSDGPGHGATFVVELPMRPTPLLPAQAPAGPQQLSVPARGPLRILLVEDHADTGRVVARLLRIDGHDVQHAVRLDQALKLFAEHPFDLVISDLGLPDGTGLDLMRQIRAARPDIAGICFSGYGMDQDHQASAAAGFCEHLTKPADFGRLTAAIDRIRGRSVESAPR